jgi:hypothetical protein
LGEASGSEAAGAATLGGSVRRDWISWEASRQGTRPQELETLFSLNESASAIWQAADGRTPLAEIVERAVCAEYDVAPEEALRDAEDLVRDLAAHGILRISDQPIQA